MFKESIADVFRRWGFLQAQIDNLGRLAHFALPQLDEASGKEAEEWRRIYCGPIGAEFMHMPFPDRAAWVAKRMEGAAPKVDKKFILRRVAEVELFERFLHTKYVGVTRFSAEGSASVVTLLDAILINAANAGYEYVIMGMSHRARLAVMALVVGSPVANIIACFEDPDPKSSLGRGDVKYHKGATGTYTSPTGKSMRVHLASNPSHLEAINPVVMGRVKARQYRLQDKDRSKALAILLHGDAAFAGQGINAEALNFASLNGFDIGGTIHIIINNLIGFTEAPSALHSSRFSSDIAKRNPIPIFHVNGEDPEAVFRVGTMAGQYRHEWKSDVVVDLVGYRRHGHNEGDDPSITQPVLYQEIAKRPPLYKLYAEQSSIKPEELSKLEEEINSELAAQLEEGRGLKQQPAFSKMPDYWAPFRGGWYDSSLEVNTSVPAERLRELSRSLTSVPKGFTVHPKVKKVLEQRLEMGEGKRPVDWAMAEALAFASLVTEGRPVRLTGQDCRRGTFSHRHAVLIDHKNGSEHCALAQLGTEHAFFEAYDSMLSEAAALGFEYGFTRDYPEALVLWEAQFGDFVNGAQIIIDQFLAAGEDKWGLLSGLVLLLPHGYEGRGPEHSSARIERFLQLAAEDNIQVCYPSTSAQYFHMLRRQVLRSWRKPLVVATPKSMLRSAAASSPVTELAEGSFQNVLVDGDLASASRVLICTGKIAHELAAERARLEDTATAIVRVEQLYPFPERELADVLAQAGEGRIVWVQEEPENMGALSYIRPLLQRLAGERTVSAVKRFQSASPATGSAKAHAMEQQMILRLAFAQY